MNRKPKGPSLHGFATTAVTDMERGEAIPGVTAPVPRETFAQFVQRWLKARERRVEADTFDVEMPGLLTLMRGTDTVGAFATGSWTCIERIEPDKYAEATAAVS